MEYITVTNLEIFDKPKGSLIFKKNSHKFLPFQITELQGDWLKVKKPRLHYSHFNDSINYDGWVRWKKDMEILVDVTEHSYE